MPSLSERPLSRARAMTCALTNLLGVPGLGSFMGKRRIAGSCQILLSIVGCGMILVWLLELIMQSLNYSQTTGGLNLHTINSIGWAGGVLLAVAWLWSAVTSFSMLQEASSNRLRSLEKSAAPPPLKLNEARIFLALASVPNWKKNGDVISRTFQFKDFPAAMKFTDAIAQIAEEDWHHPDIDIRWNKVTLALTTHDAGGLTEKDFALAKKFDELSLQ